MNVAVRLSGGNESRAQTLGSPEFQRR